MNPILLACTAALLAMTSSLSSQSQFELAGEQQLATGNLATRQAVAGDLDGDRDTDLVFVVWGKAPHIHLNDGRGRFKDVTSTNIPPTLMAPGDIALVDVDADRDLDIVVADSRYVDRLFLNDGNGRFVDATATHFPSDVVQSYSIGTGDVDADGDVDIMLGTRTGSPDRLLLNDGRGRFTDVTAQRMPNLPFHDYSPGLALVDVDGDRDLDCVLANRTTNRLYLNDGKGTFTNAPSQIPSQGIGGPIAAGDADGDGDADIFGAWFGGQNRLLLNDGRGRFTDATSRLPTDRDSSAEVLLRDVDGDGDLDAIYANLSRFNVNKLYVNDGRGNFKDAGQLATENGFDAVSGDFDGNGTLDIVISGAQSHMFFGDGDGGFDKASRGGIPIRLADQVGATAFGDLNGDGLPEIVVGRGNFSGNFLATPYVNRLYENDGYGGFVEVAGVFGRADLTTDVACVDVDGDGDLDVVTANAPHTYRVFRDGENELFLNDGEGKLTRVTATHMPAHRDFSSGLAHGDVDGNGTVDLVFANSREDRLYLGDGKGKFTDASSQLPQVSGFSRRVLLVDVDRDRDLDLVIAASQRDRLYLNDGKGNFQDATGRLPDNGVATYGLVAIDIEGDGDTDLVAATQASLSRATQDTLFVNDGSGRFTIQNVRLPVELTVASAVVAADIDGDSDTDLIFGDQVREGTRHRVLINDGRGRFTKAVTRLPSDPGAPTQLVLGDTDLDGDLDLLSASNRLDLFTNRHRQLRAPSALRLSVPFDLELWSQPGYGRQPHVAFTYFQLNEQDPPIYFEPWGHWRIQIIGELPLGPFVIPPASGTTKMTLRFPNAPALIGKKLYVQGWIFDSSDINTSRFTNLVAERISR